MKPDDIQLVVNNAFHCKNCGATLHFEPGTNQLKCDHCGLLNDIEGTEKGTKIGCYDYNQFIEDMESAPAGTELRQVRCGNCGSRTTLPKNVTADKCPFCSSPLIIELDDSRGYVRPHYILPFELNQQLADEKFKKWIKGLSFAPGDLVQKVNSRSQTLLEGVYLPYWAYDADAETNYEGEQGNHYWVTETYTETVDGKQRVNTRQVMHTNWCPVSGTVDNSFSNIIIPASSSLPAETLNKIGRWRLDMLSAYDERFISGFRAENYQLTPQGGLEIAKKGMMPVINNTICKDIGGDEQRIADSKTELSDIGIKYLLLPVWVASYIYNKKLYQVTINASTGEVNGRHPWSVLKIAGLVILILVVIVALMLIFYQQ